MDGISNFVAIIQTKNTIIAGYYSGRYEDGPMREESLLISLSSKKCYKLHQTNERRKSMSYSSDGCNFGNWDMQIYYRRGMIKGNYGRNSSYDFGGDDIKTLFGESGWLNNCTD